MNYPGRFGERGLCGDLYIACEGMLSQSSLFHDVSNVRLCVPEKSKPG
jgi:hypothetical protein